MKAKILGIFGLLIALCVFMTIMTAEPWYDLGSSKFLLPNNIENLVRRTSMYGILGIGVAFVIITSGIDLSIGSIVCLSACLLAICLRVDYAPFGTAEVLSVRGSQQQIVVPEDGNQFRPGDLVFYDGGHAAGREVLKVVELQPSQFESEDGSLTSAVTLQVDKPLSSDDDYGQVSKVYVVESFQQASDTDANSQVIMAGEHPELEARDRITFIDPRKAARKTMAVLDAESSGGRTAVRLEGDLGRDFDQQWLARPVQRQQRMSVPLALLTVLAVALGLGLVHGLLITKLRLQSFVVTLCGLLVYRGISRWMVNDQPVGFGNEFQNSLSALGSGKFVFWQFADGSTLGIPYPFFILVLVGIVALIFLNKTIWGRYMLALGRNEEAARYSGIHTSRMTMIAYIISAILAAVGGILFALDSNSVSPSSFGESFELYAIAAAVLGGCSLRGGEGTILGVIIGTAVMQILNNLIILMKISETLEFAVVGMVILLGVIADELIKRVAAKRRRLAQTRG